MNVAIVLLALLLVPAAQVSGRGGHVSDGDPRNPAIYPPQRVTLEFSHRLHLDAVGFACVDCHESVGDSRSAKDYNVPERGICLDCHDAAEVPHDWSPKHRRAGNAVALPPANLRFPHAVHVGLDGVECTTCHAGVPEADLAGVEHLPRMETCLGCHDGVAAPDDCLTCHLPGRGGAIRTAFATGSLVPDDHGVHWRKQHEIAAERDLAYCGSCHAQSDCLECHEGSIPPSFHDGNYLARHPRDGLANNPTCAACHRLDKFCRDCHFRAGVTQFDVIPPGGFHPAGWGEFILPGQSPGPSHHAHVAKKNLLACRACHQEDDCTSCHLWFPGAPSTHPPGWKGSDRARRLRRENTALCLQCHDPANPSDPINEP
jgi:hypothetical protein